MSSIILHFSLINNWMCPPTGRQATPFQKIFRISKGFLLFYYGLPRIHGRLIANAGSAKKAFSVVFLETNAATE
jgi:hypothetical protein